MGKGWHTPSLGWFHLLQRGDKGEKKEREQAQAVKLENEDDLTGCVSKNQPE